MGHTILRPAWFMQNFSETLLKLAGAIANGIRPEYGPVLRQLTETIASGHGSRPNGIVEKITGTPPHTFRNFTHSNANAWKAAK